MKFKAFSVLIIQEDDSRCCCTLSQDENSWHVVWTGTRSKFSVTKYIQHSDFPVLLFSCSRSINNEHIFSRKHHRFSQEALNWASLEIWRKLLQNGKFQIFIIRDTFSFPCKLIRKSVTRKFLLSTISTAVWRRKVCNISWCQKVHNWNLIYFSQEFSRRLEKWRETSSVYRIFSPWRFWLRFNKV